MDGGDHHDLDGLRAAFGGRSAGQSTSPSCSITVLRAVDGKRATKRWSWNPTLGGWIKVSYSAGAWFTPSEHQVADLAGLVGVLDMVRSDPSAFVVRGGLAPAAAEAVAKNPKHRILRRKHLKEGVAPTLIEAPQQWVMLDIDGWPLRASDDLATDPESAIDAAICDLLPDGFHGVECWWQLSSSAGFVPGVLKAHLFFWLSEPADNRHITAVLKQHAPAVDRAPFSAAQPHYIADPIIEGGPDPLPRRTGWRRGMEPAVVLPALIPQAARPSTGGATGIAGNVVEALATLGDGEGRDGFHAPLRTATLRYAQECNRTGGQDDAAFKAELLDAIHAAPRRADRNDLASYDNPYLQRLIDGAFALLAGSASAASQGVPPVQPKTPSLLRPYYDAPTELRDEALARQRALIEDTIKTGAVSGAARRKIAKLREEAVAADPDFDQRSPAEKGAVTRQIKRAVLAEQNLTRLPPTNRILISGSQGSGKTHVSSEITAGLLVDVVVRITQPSHEKAAEVLADYEAIATATSLPALLVRGRSSLDPMSAEEERMCLRHDVATRAARKGVSVRKAICGSCAFESSCGYIRQEKQIKAMNGRGVFIAARAYNFLPCPAPTADILIADESITLEAIDAVLSEAPSILKSPVPFEGSNLGNIMAANQTTSRLADVLVGPKPLAQLRAKGPTKDELQFAKDMLERAIDARQTAAISGTMTDAEIHTVLDNQQANLAGSALVILNAVLHELGQPRDVFNGISFDPAARVVVDGREERQPRLRIHRLRQLHGITADTTVLLLDGTGSERLNRALLPDLVHHRIAIERDAHVTGTSGRNYSRQSITGEDRHGIPVPNKEAAAARLRWEVKQIAERLPGNTLVIASLKAATKLREDGVADADLIAHFGKLRGRNEWEGCESALSLGMETVSVEAIETLARPFMVNDPVPFISSVGPIDDDWTYKQWPFKATRGRRMRDGTVQPVEVEVHPDPRVQEVLEQVREAEVLQGGDRVRPIFNRRTMVFANSLALDLTYDRIVTHKELVAGGSRLERVFADLGVLPLGSRDLHAAYSAPAFAAGFSTKSAADDCLKQQALSGGVSQIVLYLKNPPTYSYRRRGQAGSASRALIDTSRHPNPRLALEALLGALASDPVLVPPDSPNPNPPGPPQPEPPEPPNPDPDPPPASRPPPPPAADDDADDDELPPDPPPGHPAWDQPPPAELDGWEPVEWDDGHPAGVSWDALEPPLVLTCDAPWLHPKVAAYPDPSGGIAVLCPYCGWQHRHGGFGHRLAHCDVPRGQGYVLIPAATVPPWAVFRAPSAASQTGNYGDD